MKQALIDVYSAECARLQSEVKRLSVADVASGSEDVNHRHHRQQQQQQQASPVSSAAADVQKISQVFHHPHRKILDVGYWVLYARILMIRVGALLCSRNEHADLTRLCPICRIQTSEH